MSRRPRALLLRALLLVGLLAAAYAPAASPAPTAAPAATRAPAATSAPAPTRAPAATSAPAATNAPAAAPATGATPAAAAGAPVHVKMADTAGAIGNAPVYIAIERGYFQQQGIDLEFADFPGGAQMISSIATSQV
ncbi:MAG TPA: ABC transporter substrate-binding protein, partial [Dehalococcoidia bacterium]|nr:ABC transporter substrate-binding protein [Dehalococcoidia bacterium]